MLSYRHAFHAGNFADVLKHTVLVDVLSYMGKKDKAFTYIDTHSGAGMYSLHDAYAQKTGEYKDGIAKLWQRDDLPPLLSKYVEFIKSLNTNNQLDYYPGSPCVAKHWLRQQDLAHFYELHPNDFKLLDKNMQGRRRIKTYQSDGYKGIKAHFPCVSRRGVVLIDPPYEIKSDYKKAVEAIKDGYKRLPSASYLLWYPVVQRHYINEMQQAFERSEVKNVLQIELAIAPDSDEFGMTSTGLFVVNPPWTLKQELEQVMPYLVEHLGGKDASFKLTQLVEE